MPKVSARYLEGRRAEILEAALVCFARNGFHETTIADISRQAGLSHGAIYRYFPGKEEIIDAVSERDRGARARRFERAERAGSALTVLDLLLATYLESQAGPEHLDQRQLRVQVLGEAVRRAPVNSTVRATWSEVLERIGSTVRRGQVAGEIDPGVDAGAVARVVAALHDGLLIHAAVDPDVDLAGCMQVVRALLRGLGRSDQREAGNDGREHGLHPSAP